MEGESKIIKIKEIKKILETDKTKEYSITKMIETIEYVEIRSTPIGEGGNALVYSALGTDWENFCLKKIKAKPQLIYNSIDKEHEFQIKAQDAGVRTPFTVASITTDDGEYLVMERIEGYSVGDIIKKPKLLPKDFDFKTFCDSLDDQIKKLHGKGIYHRDLRADNIMIDKKGQPVIIDFGTATEGTGSDLTYEESVSMYDPKKGRYSLVNGYFKDDLEMVKNVKSSLKSLIPINPLT